MMNTLECCWIILRDVPKEQAQIDTDIYTIQGGFRGFQNVKPGLHYVGVKVEKKFQGFWHYLKPYEVLVKVFNHTYQKFTDDELETETHFQKLALGGAMDHVLIRYNDDSWEIWEKLTNLINPPVFSPILGKNIVNIPVDNPNDLLLEPRKTRFEQTLFNQHSGDIDAFLSEFQFAFVKWYANEDIEAFNRWNYLLQAVYNASEFGIAKSPSLFFSLIDVLLAQFDCIPDDIFTSNSFITAHASYLAEDMIDTEIQGIVRKGQEFEAYLSKRGVLPN